MTPAEQITALQLEHAALLQVIHLQAQLATALARIPELEQRPLDPPDVGKPNTAKWERKPSRTRKSEHNRAHF